jgi:dipeptidyl aminopeptidase/acylaminoacyl peptidase
MPLAAQRHALTVDDLWAVRRVGAPVLSPDGTQVAYTITTYDMEENRGNADIWLQPLAAGPARRLTTNKASDSAPAWSPDGTRIAFVSRRDGDTAGQVYVIPVAGGEAERVTDMPLGAGDVKWLPDGRRLVFAAHVIAGAESAEETKKKLEAREKSKVKARVSEQRLFRFWDRWLTDEEYPHLFVLDLETRKVTDLLPGSRRHFSLQDGSASYDVSPDGTQLVFAANSTEPPYRTLNSDLFVVPTAGGAVRNLTADNAANDNDPVFSPDGRTLAYGREQKADGWPDYTRLALLDMASGRTRVLTEGWDNSPADWSFTPDGNTLVFSAEVRARTHLYALPVAGGQPRQVHAGGSALGAQATPGGQLVFLRHDLSHPPELHVVGLDGQGLRALTRVNDELLATLDLGAVQDLTFKGAGDAPVQMYVVFPPGFDAKRRYPLVHVIHGGPVGTSADGFHFRWNAHAFAAPGYVVALVNFHGSSSFGQPFVESILGAHGDKPLQDILRATDHLIAQGYVDDQRLAAAGGSYGGYLVNWIAGHSARFKALVSHAGVYSQPGQFASDATWGRHHSYGGYTFTNLAAVERQSPHRFASAFRTPMLILHGERDFRVPVTQGLELHGVLTAKGVPSRLVYYPDENHWILKPQNSRHWHGEVLGWLKRWLD